MIMSQSMSNLNNHKNHDSSAGGRSSSPSSSGGGWNPIRGLLFRNRKLEGGDAAGPAAPAPEELYVNFHSPAERLLGRQHRQTSSLSLLGEHQERGGDYPRRWQRQQRRLSMPEMSQDKNDTDAASFTGMMIVAKNSKSHLDKSTSFSSDSCSSEDESVVSEVTLMTYKAEINEMIKEEFRRRLQAECDLRGEKLSLEEGKELLRKVQVEQMQQVQQLQQEQKELQQQEMDQGTLAESDTFAESDEFGDLISLDSMKLRGTQQEKSEPTKEQSEKMHILLSQNSQNNEQTNEQGKHDGGGCWSHQLIKTGSSTNNMMMAHVQSFSSIGTAKHQNYSGRQNSDWTQESISNEERQEKADRWNRFLKTSKSGSLAQVQSFCSIDRTATARPSSSKHTYQHGNMAQVQSFSTMRGMMKRHGTQDDDWNSMRQTFDLARAGPTLERQHRPAVGMHQHQRTGSWNQFPRQGNSKTMTMARVPSFSSVGVMPGRRQNFNWESNEKTQQLAAGCNNAVLGMNEKNQSINFSNFLHSLPERSQERQENDVEVEQESEEDDDIIPEQEQENEEAEAGIPPEAKNNDGTEDNITKDTTTQSDSQKSHIDEIIELKLLIANQQATIDTLSSKLHNLELDHRKLLAKEESKRTNLEEENEALAMQLKEYQERDSSRNQLVDLFQQQQQEQQQLFGELERRNQDLMNENSDLIRQLQDRNCPVVPPVLTVCAMSNEE